MNRDESKAHPIAMFRGLVNTVLVLGLGLGIIAGFYFGTFSSQVDWSLR
jgi:hypothetical protein